MSTPGVLVWVLTVCWQAARDGRPAIDWVEAAVVVVAGAVGCVVVDVELDEDEQAARLTAMAALTATRVRLERFMVSPSDPPGGPDGLKILLIG